MEARLIDLNTLSEMTMISTKTLRKIIKEDETFPKPVNLGPRMTRWKYSDVVNWIENKQ